MSTRVTALAPTDRSHSVLGSGATEKALTTFLNGIPGVDTVGAEARAAGFATRSIKTTSKMAGLDMIMSMVELTTLEGADTRGKVHTLAQKATLPDPFDPTAPSVAAVCVYGDKVAEVRESLGSWHISHRADGIAVAAVATAFPSGRASLPVKILDTEYAVSEGADEIDMVIDRGAFLSGSWGLVYDQIVAVKEACRRGDGSYAHLKVILETGELATLDNVRRASWLAILAGADFIKTSTGKVAPAATLPVTVTMLEVIRDWYAMTGEKIGMKPAGGIKASKDALRYLVAVAETVGEDWLTPDLFRFGASSLLNDVVMQRQKMRNGHYSGPDYVSVD